MVFLNKYILLGPNTIIIRKINATMSFRFPCAQSDPLHSKQTTKVKSKGHLWM